MLGFFFVCFFYCFPFKVKHILQKQEGHCCAHAMFLFPVLTPCLAECSRRSQLAAGGKRAIHSPVLRSPLPEQGARRAIVSQTGLQRCPRQQTASSPNPGAELVLSSPARSVRPAQKPPLPNSPASGSEPESVQRSGIHRGGHSRDTPVSLGFTGTPPAFFTFYYFFFFKLPLRLCKGKVRLL